MRKELRQKPDLKSIIMLTLAGFINAFGKTHTQNGLGGNYEKVY